MDKIKTAKVSKPKCQPCTSKVEKLEAHRDEKIDHPSHYKGNKYEAIDIIEDFDLNFNLGNALKYILRAGKKNEVADQRDLDLKKAAWYLNREINREGEE